MSMTLAELRSEVAKIAAIPEYPEGFHEESFSCGSGGAPRNRAGVPEVRRSSEYKYDTVRHGGAYSGEVVVLCRDTGTRDAENRKIYATPEGLVFVYRYRAGSPESFDSGSLIAPELA